HYLLRHLVLKLKYIVQRTVKAVRPCVSAAHRIDQLGRNSQSTPSLAHTAFEDKANAKFAADLSDVGRFSFVSKTRVARDHKQRFETRQRGDDVLHHAVSEILLLGIARHVLEWQNSDRGLVWQRQCRRDILGSGDGGWPRDRIGPDRLVDILDLLRAQIGE